VELAANIIQGSGESGKSTIVKQMKIIHQSGYTVEELSMYRMTIYKNLVDCAKALIGAMRQFDIEPEDPINGEYCDFLVEYQVVTEPPTLNPEVGEAVQSLWKDPSMVTLMERQSEFYLMDSAP
jgi:guanine nucleotide-binding protein G(i) subunit alpha